MIWNMLLMSSVCLFIVLMFLSNELDRHELSLKDIPSLSKQQQQMIAEEFKQESNAIQRFMLDLCALCAIPALMVILMLAIVCGFIVVVFSGE